jgi:hypothetical protein
MASWVLNVALDNQGGRLHFVSQKLRQLSWFALAAQIIAAVRVNTSYVRSAYWFVNATVDGKTVGSANVATDERIWLFNPENTVAGEFDARDVDSMTHQQQNWISIFVIAGAMSLAAAPLQNKYELAVYEAEMAEWEETNGVSEEDDSTADDAEVASEDAAPAF